MKSHWSLITEEYYISYRHDLHIIMDEIYGLSVWAENSMFHSVLSLKDVPDPNKTHFVWSFSKVGKPLLIEIMTLSLSSFMNS